MDVSLNFWDTSEQRPKYLENVLSKTTVLPPWFWALSSKALEEVLNSLHEFVVLSVVKVFVPNEGKIY